MIKAVQVRGVEEYVRWKNSQSPNTFLEILDYFYPDGKIPERCSSNYKLTWDYILKHVGWNWSTLSANPNITFEMAKGNPDLPWDWAKISERSFVTWETIVSHRDLPWNSGAVSRNPNMTAKIVNENLDFPWNFEELAKNSNIPPRELKAILKESPSDAIELAWCQNTQITMDIVRGFRVLDPSSEEEADILEDRWMFLSGNRGITEEMIRENLDLPWIFTQLNGYRDWSLDFVRTYFKDFNCFTSVSHNRNVDIDFIIEFKNKIWDWGWLTQTIPVKVILCHLDLPWEIHRIVWNPTMTRDLLDRVKHLAVDLAIFGSSLSSSLLIDMDYVLKNRQWKWSWQRLTTNPQITGKDILENPTLPWDRNYVFQNPNINVEVLKILKVERRHKALICHNMFDLSELRGNPHQKLKCIERDARTRRQDVRGPVSDLLGKDVCSIVLLYVSYD